MAPDLEESPMAKAITAQRALEHALTGAGIDPAQFPHMAADVDAFNLPRVQLGHIGIDTAGQLTAAIAPTTADGGDWELRYSWASGPGVTHPGQSFEKRSASRENVETYALMRWERAEQGITMTAVDLRQLPDGDWEQLLPIEAPCEIRPGGYIGQEAAAP